MSSSCTVLLVAQKPSNVSGLSARLFAWLQDQLSRLVSTIVDEMGAAGLEVTEAAVTEQLKARKPEYARKPAVGVAAPRRPCGVFLGDHVLLSRW